MFTICNECQAEGSKVTARYAEVEYCDECGSVEQGFEYFDEWEHNNGYLIDENSMIYTEEFDLLGPEDLVETPLWRLLNE